MKFCQFEKVGTLSNNQLPPSQKKRILKLSEEIWVSVMWDIGSLQVKIQGTWAPLDPRFWGPKIEHFWALFNFFIYFFALLCSEYYFFNILPFHSSNSKIFEPCFTRHIISHLKVFHFGPSFTHFILLGIVYEYLKLIELQSNVLFLSAFGVEVDVNN